MKKVFLIFLVVLFVPLSAFAKMDYSPELNMKIDEFISKYNAIGSALGSPLVALTLPASWSEWSGYHVAWFRPDSKSSISLVLMSKDQKAGKNLQAGLDRIQIQMDDEKDFLSFLTVSERCTRLFVGDVLTMSFSPFVIYELIEYYYENNSDVKNYTAYKLIQSDMDYYSRFFKSGSQYVYEICYTNGF